MTLFSQLQQQIDVTPVAEAPADADLTLAADTREVLVYRTADGGWFYRLKLGNPPAGLLVSADYSELRRVPW